jgi:hypothetical protein
MPDDEDDDDAHAAMIAVVAKSAATVYGLLRTRNSFMSISL